MAIQILELSVGDLADVPSAAVRRAAVGERRNQPPGAAGKNLAISKEAGNPQR